VHGKDEVELFAGSVRITVAGQEYAPAYSDLARYAEALPLQERSLAVAEVALGPGHPSTALRLDNLAQTYGALLRPLLGAVGP
jgi:hypothetical protein